MSLLLRRIMAGAALQYMQAEGFLEDCAEASAMMSGEGAGGGSNAQGILRRRLLTSMRAGGNGDNDDEVAESEAKSADEVAEGEQLVEALEELQEAEVAPIRSRRSSIRTKLKILISTVLMRCDVIQLCRCRCAFHLRGCMPQLLPSKLLGQNARHCRLPSPLFRPKFSVRSALG